jgi:hypothetical protein
MGYFVLASRRIPDNQALLCAGLFFLPGITSMLDNLVYMGGGIFYYLYYIIPANDAFSQTMAEQNDTMYVRIGGWIGVSQAICLFLLARFGAKGIMDMSRPWRGFIFVVAMVAGMFSGFRSNLIFLGLIFSLAFVLEGLHRTRYLLSVIVLGVVAGLGLLFFSSHLPYSMQRAVSFLPVQVSPFVRDAADGSTAWRLEMWRDVLPEVSGHLLKGKGYALDPNDIYMAQQNELRGKGIAASLAEAAGDYHNGPLSVLIPFGIWGALALTWFLFAVGRTLFQHYAHGDPALRTINVTLLACYFGKIVFFLAIFGSISTDLAFFTGIAGLSVSLNGETRHRLLRQTVDDEFCPVHV